MYVRMAPGPTTIGIGVTEPLLPKIRSNEAVHVAPGPATSDPRGTTTIDPPRMDITTATRPNATTRGTAPSLLLSHGSLFAGRPILVVPPITINLRFFAGSADADVLFGTPLNDFVYGLGGADVMLGGAGDDGYFVDEIGDVVVEHADEGVDTVYSAIDYRLDTNLENLTLAAGAATFATGNDRQNHIRGNDVANVLAGLAGDDFLDGCAGADVMFGGVGNDGFVVDDVGDLAIEQEGEGSDTVYAFIDYQLVSTLENLRLFADAAYGIGNDGDNLIVGNATANILDGRGGADILEGGLGDDVLLGGGGSDTFVYGGSSFGSDRIDFVASGPERDVLQFSTSLFMDYAAVMAASTQVGSDVVITSGDDSSITLQSVQLSALTSENVRFA